MDMRRMSNWNVLSVEAALQQLNAFEGDDPEKIIRRPNTVSEFIFCNINNLSRLTGRKGKISKIIASVTSQNYFGNNLCRRLVVIFHFTHIEKLQIASTRDVQSCFFYISSGSSTSVRIDNEDFRDIDIVYSRFFST